MKNLKLLLVLLLSSFALHGMGPDTFITRNQLRQLTPEERQQWQDHWRLCKILNLHSRSGDLVARVQNFLDSGARVTISDNTAATLASICVQNGKNDPSWNTVEGAFFERYDATALGYLARQPTYLGATFHPCAHFTEPPQNVIADIDATVKLLIKHAKEKEQRPVDLGRALCDTIKYANTVVARSLVQEGASAYSGCPCASIVVDATLDYYTMQQPLDLQRIIALTSLRRIMKG